MARKTSDQLFQLIQSLNKNEKRHFKLYMEGLSTVENKKVIQLFNAINKQKIYDEDQLVERIPELDRKQLPNLKSYLSDKILQCLRIYASGRVVEIQIRQQIDFAQLLFERRIYKTGKEYLNKAKRTAENYERLELLLEIIRIEKSIILDTIDNENIHLVDQTIKEIKKINTQISNINLFSSLTLKLEYYFAKIGSVRNEKDFNDVVEFYKDNVPTIREENLSESEQIYYFNFQITYNSFIQDFNKNYQYATRLLKIFHFNPVLMNTRPGDYLKALHLMLIAEYNLFDYPSFTRSLEELKKYALLEVVSGDESLAFRTYKYLYLHEINLYYLEGNFTSGIKELFGNDTIVRFIEKTDDHTKLIFYYKIACLYFGSGQYNLSVKWLNKIINEPSSMLREDLHCFARIVHLISHYELENFDVINYYIISTYRFLLKKADLHSFQKYIIEFLRKLAKVPDTFQLMQMFQLLKTQLLPLTESRFESRAFHYFDIISWLESRIEKKPVEEIVKRNVTMKISKSKMAAIQ